MSAPVIDLVRKLQTELEGLRLAADMKIAALAIDVASEKRRADAAEAACAAMRAALSVATTPLPEDRETVRAALDGTAGRALAARVTLLEAVVREARGLRWVHPDDRARYEQSFDVVLAALDEKGGI